MSLENGTIKRTTVRIEENLHTEWKITATRQKVNMDDYIAKALRAQLDHDNQPGSDEVIELHI